MPFAVCIPAMQHNETNELTPAQILDRHPLFRRLSGQIVWYMFEEHEARDIDTEAFMDRMEAQREEVLEQVELALEQEEMFVKISTASGTVPCEHCAQMTGRYIDLSTPGAERLLPPYALGCPLKGELLPPTQPAPDKESTLQPDDAVPHGELICGEWIFTHPWGDE